MNVSSQPPGDSQPISASARIPQPASSLASGSQVSPSGSLSATATSPITTTSRPSVDKPPSGIPPFLKTTFSSLSNRNFLFLWLGMLFLMAATQMQMLARGYLVYDLTGSGTILGYVNLGIAVPMLTIPLFGGAIADRFERKTIIQFAQTTSAILGLTIALMIHTNIIAWHHLMFSAMVQGGLWAFMMPARQAIIPQLVGPEKVTNAMALNAAGMSATTIAAPAMAGWVYAHLGPWNVYYIISLLSVASIVLTVFIPKTGGGDTEKKSSMLVDIYEGLKYVRSQNLLLVLILMGLITTMLAMPFRFIMPVFVVDIYKQGPDSMGLLVGMMGLGAMLGALYVASVGRRNRGMLIIIGSLFSGIGLLLVALIPIYSVAAVIMIVLGLGDSGRMSLNQTLIVEEAEDRYRGRVMSIYMLNFGLMPLGTFPAASLTDYLGGQAVVGLLGLMLLGVTALIFLTQHQLRRLN